MSSSVKHLSTGQVEAMARSEPAPLLLDVRTEPEWETHHISGALLIPMHTLLQRLDELDRDRPVVVICEHGVRSERVAAYLAAEAGFSDVATMDGGMSEWTGPKAYGA